MRTRLLSRLLFLAATALLPLAAHAQTVPEPEQMETNANAPADYCTMLWEGSPMPDTFKWIDFGQGTKEKSYTPEQAEMAKKMKGQTSTVRVINYLSQRGWELADAYATHDGNKMYHYYILKRK